MRAPRPDSPPSFEVDAPLGDGPVHDPSYSVTVGDPAADRIRSRLWWGASALYRRRWFLVFMTIVAAASAVAVSLLLPNRYQAETRLLLPEGSGMGSLLDAVVPGASMLLGKGSGGYTRYLAILDSRSAAEQIVDRFNLVEVYDLEDKRTPVEDAIKMLGENSEFEVSLDFDYLSVKVMDEDPRRAAQIANFYVSYLNERHMEMSSSSAAENRRFLETRLHEAEMSLDSALVAQQLFQERNGVVQIEAQAEALMSAMAESQASIAQAEAQYEALRAVDGDENFNVQAARAALESARRQMTRLTNGNEAFMPVPLQNLPAVSRQYASILIELRTQEEIVKAVRPLYEQAALQERQQVNAVQVLDAATIPHKKAEPHRSLIVISVVVAAGLLSALLALWFEWRRAFGIGWLRRLQTGG